MQRIADLVRGLAEPIAAERGCSLWDVEYVKEGGRRVLRLLIDKTDGSVSTDDCEAVSRAIDPVLDREDPIPESYVLEVSSAGLERALKRPEHFAASIGKRVELSLYAPVDGERKYTGTLTAYDGDTVSVETGGGAKKTFDMKAVSRVGWLFEF